MNDLEHDLRALFEQRARDIDAPGLAPKQVLKRGRRRQVGTVVTGVLACVIAAGVAAAAIGNARHPSVIPGRGNGLPERTTSIGGVPVTAPAGWTLVDDWPLAAILATTSESCSFSGAGTPVDGDGSLGDGNGSSSEAVPSTTPPSGDPSGDEGTTTGRACTSEKVAYAAGVPVLQLANFPIPLMQTVCGLGDQQPPAPVPADGVAVYVADLQASPNIPALLRACGEASTDAPAGLLQTFMDVDHRTDYAAIGVIGPDATDADIATALDYIGSLSGIEVTPIPPPDGPGPGYVMASGGDADMSWRLEAGLASLARTTTLGASMITTTGFSTDARTVGFPTDRRVNDDAIDLVAGGAWCSSGRQSPASRASTSRCPPATAFRRRRPHGRRRSHPTLICRLTTGGSGTPRPRNAALSGHHSRREPHQCRPATPQYRATRPLSACGRSRASTER